MISTSHGQGPATPARGRSEPFQPTENHLLQPTKRPLRPLPHCFSMRQVCKPWMTPVAILEVLCHHRSKNCPKRPGRAPLRPKQALRPGFRKSELHETNPTPSNLNNPASVPTQMYPSVVWVMERPRPPKNPSCILHAV